jgi:hypothetical protein
MEDNLKTLKVEYLRNHGLDLGGTLVVWLMSDSASDIYVLQCGSPFWEIFSNNSYYLYHRNLEFDSILISLFSIFVANTSSLNSSY